MASLLTHTAGSSACQGFAQAVERDCLERLDSRKTVTNTTTAPAGNTVSRANNRIPRIRWGSTSRRFALQALKRGEDRVHLSKLQPSPRDSNFLLSSSFQRVRTGSQRCSASPSPSGTMQVLDRSASESTSSAGDADVLTVELGDRSYPIYIGHDLVADGDLWRRYVSGKNVLIVTNETVAPIYLEKVTRALTGGGTSGINVKAVILPDGEQYKNMEVLMKVYDKALETRMDRKSTFVALGGGVIGDMCGYAAASYVRGVNFIQIPTTLMAQVDSSVGGKTGVNHPLGKNMIGAFYQPQCVVIDTDTLSTLPDRELASGIAEVVKYGLIRDAELFEWLEANMEKLIERDPVALAFAIRKSCENKAAIVSMDEREAGVRATLNLGHTFGHAIETGIGYGEWLHGEAVSAGMVMAADMSLRLGWIDASLVERTRVLLERAHLPVTAPAGMDAEKFKSLMMVDKKVADGQLRMILLKGPLGNCVFTGDFDHEALDQTLKAFCK